jgi:hypothetical protein
MWKPIAVPKPLTAGVALRPPLYHMVGVEQGASSAVALAPAEIRSRRMPDYQVKNVEPVAVGSCLHVVFRSGSGAIPRPRRHWNGKHLSVFEFRVEKERDHDFDAAGASV